jgi:uncharacterized membrane protein
MFEPSSAVVSRPRYVLPVVIVVFFTIGSTAAFLYHREVQEAQRYDKPDLNYGIKIVSAISAAASDKQRDVFIAKAQESRDKWRPWAEKNKALLTRLRNASALNTDAFESAYAAMPDNAPFEHGFRNFSDLSDPTKTIFSYDVAKSKGDTAPGADKRREDHTKMLQDMFEQYRDIPISTSVSAGRGQIILWATGRITERTYDPNPSPGEKPGYGGLVEVVPSYDFL